MNAARTDLLRTDAAASYLGRSGSWLNKLRSHGKGPRYLKIGGSIHYRVADLDSYLEGCMTETDDSVGTKDQP